MKITVYDTPLDFDVADSKTLKMTYPEGKVIFFHIDLKTFEHTIVATAEYDAKATHFDYIGAVMDYLDTTDLSEEEKKDFYSSYTVVEPTPRISLVKTGKVHTTKSKFLRDVTGVVEQDVELIKSVYGAPDKDIILFYSENEAKNEFVYYGYSIDPEGVMEARLTLGQDMRPMAYMVYLQLSAMEEVAEEALERYENSKKNQADEEEKNTDEKTDDVVSQTTEKKYPWSDFPLEPEETPEPTMTINQEDYPWVQVDDEVAEERENAEREREERRNTHVSPVLRNQIRNWMNRTSFKNFVDEICRRVKGQAEVINIVANVYNYLSNILEDNPSNNNMLLAAPSGCGKTETYRALRDYFKNEIPKLSVYQIDITSITEEGFKGPDTDTIVDPLLVNRGSYGVGLVFLDEFDKKLLPSFTSGGNNVNAAVQAQLLTLIEGRKVQKKGTAIDTTYTMFIGLGSYDVCRKKKVDTQKHHLGFQKIEEAEQVEHYTPITREDMIELGASYEMIGRFPMVVNYYKLDEETANQIIDDTAKKISLSVRIPVRISKNMRAKLHEAANGHYGCRILYSMIQQAVMSGYAQLLYDGELENASSIVVEDENKISVRKRRKSKTKTPAEAES